MKKYGGKDKVEKGGKILEKGMCMGFGVCVWVSVREKEGKYFGKG